MTKEIIQAYFIGHSLLCTFEVIISMPISALPLYRGEFYQYSCLHRTLAHHILEMHLIDLNIQYRETRLKLRGFLHLVCSDIKNNYTCYV